MESSTRLDNCVRESLTTRERSWYRLLASKGSASSGALSGMIIGETHRRGAELASNRDRSGLIIGHFDVSKGLYDGLDEGVSTVVARLVAEKGDVLHELGTELLAREVRWGVVGAEEQADCLEGLSKSFLTWISSSQRSTKGIKSGLDKIISRCFALEQQVD